ncbi:virB8 family protein [Neisseria sp. Ec49-e6-T10]|uniref:virB8 family protein n=1 Tax=Neisseria sp. Ec49-e6-T10 TaxID=3140744 RepID=UPI003EBB1716
MKKIAKNNTKGNSNIDKAIQQSCDFEVTLVDIRRKNERRAWTVALLSVCMSVLLAAGYLLVMPLKERVPYIVMADPYSGRATVSKITDYAGESLTSNEAVIKSNVAQFVTARESYDWDLISRRDWDTVYSMGSENVTREYRALFANTNPMNPDVIFGRKKSVRIKIKSIILNGATAEHGPTGATVNFDRLVIDKIDPKIEQSSSHIASVVFEYKNNLAMSDQYRTLNPLGFRVISYRVDTDGAGPAPSALGEHLMQETQPYANNLPEQDRTTPANSAPQPITIDPNVPQTGQVNSNHVPNQQQVIPSTQQGAAQ